MTVEEAARVLRNVYDSPPGGRKSTAIHLFGIKYANELRSLSIREVVNRSGIPDYVAEINKGRNLAEYVKLRQGIEL